MTKATSYRDIEMKVLQWAEARKIIPNSYPLAQARKTAEETTELVEAAAKLRLLEQLKDHLPPEVYEGNREIIMDEFKDAVGDVMVTLVNACALADVDAVDCFAGSYDEIKHRKGTLMPNGVFVKEE